MLKRKSDTFCEILEPHRSPVTKFPIVIKVIINRDRCLLCSRAGLPRSRVVIRSAPEIKNTDHVRIVMSMFTVHIFRIVLLITITIYKHGTNKDHECGLVPFVRIRLVRFFLIVSVPKLKLKISNILYTGCRTPSLLVTHMTGCHLGIYCCCSQNT